MFFSNSIRLLFENFKNSYKILLYKVIVSLISTALCCAMLLPELNDIMESWAMQDFIADCKALFTAFFSANAVDLSVVKQSLFGAEGTLATLTSFIYTKATSLILALIGCAVVYLLKRIADTLCYFAVGSVINDKMSAYANTPFKSAYVVNLGKAFRYALLYVPVVFVWDMLTIAMIVLLITTVNLIPALFFSMTILALMQAGKLTITWRWIPSMLNGAKLRDSLRSKEEVEKKQRTKIFGCYLCSVYFVIVVNVVVALATFGSGLLITVPASYLLFLCMQLVNYYTLKGKKYFITYNNIAVNPDRGDREHVVNYLDETAVDPTVVVEMEKTENE